jgi:hypothetical protein
MRAVRAKPREQRAKQQPQPEGACDAGAVQRQKHLHLQIGAFACPGVTLTLVDALIPRGGANRAEGEAEWNRRWLLMQKERDRDADGYV